MIRVHLTTFEWGRSATVGMQRQIASVLAKRKERFAKNRDPWDKHIEGACGECATAKALGIYWDGSVNTFKDGGDVGPYQVRTRSDPNYGLNIRADDKDDRIFILCIGRSPNFTIHGWMTAGEVKRHPEWILNPNGWGEAWFAPKEVLFPMEDLPELQENKYFASGDVLARDRAGSPEQFLH